MENKRIHRFLPGTKKETEQLGWEQPDVILFTGDAYVDHPSFGTSVIGRLLESKGYKVAIIPQPNWRDDLRDFKKLGKPLLFFGVSSGCMDSMVNHYTANKRLRSNDAYTPGARAGMRPDYAVTVYSKILKKLFPEVPVVIGGIEASLRRFAHYDYWSDSIKPPVLIDSKADILVYGMGERPILEIAEKLDSGLRIREINVKQTAVIRTEIPADAIKLSSHEACLKDKKLYAQNFAIVETESNKMNARVIAQESGDKTVVVYPPFPVMTEQEMDAIYDLPYTRLPHFKYNSKDRIPAYEMIRHSVNIHRGCFGGCSFCTISAHQGKFVSSRSEKSILKEVRKITEMHDFSGYISDVGGPSANMYKMEGKDQDICKACKRPSCIYPEICQNLNTDHTKLMSIYDKVSSQPGVKKAFVTSGIRYDLPLKTNNSAYLKKLIKNHVSGRLKVAPEHTQDKVLRIMRKPSFEHYYELKKMFDSINKAEGLKQQIIPYFISSHPGSEIVDMAELAVKTKGLDIQLEQVQDFTPTPMTLATVIYYTGLDPYTLQPVKTARTPLEKTGQRKYFFWYKPENKDAIKRELRAIRRDDLLRQL